MKILSDLINYIICPGKVGKSFSDVQLEISFKNVLLRILLFLIIPTAGLSWTLIYSIVGSQNLTIMLLYNEDVAVLGTLVPIWLLELTLVWIILLFFWFIPVLITWGINVLIPENRESSLKKQLGLHLMSSTGVFSLYYLFLPIAFLLIPTGASFFSGMKSIEDTVYSIGFLITFIFQFIFLAIISKNFFQKGFWPSLLSSLIIFSIMIYLLFILFS
ncbi:MAG: hypothetical protein ACTSVI_08770 [Promethearchaeota archaeon]